jgi:hypothetical protein
MLDKVDATREAVKEQMANAGEKMRETKDAMIEKKEEWKLKATTASQKSIKYMKHLDLETVAKIDAKIDTSDWRWAPTGAFDWIACGILLLSLVYAFTVDVQTFMSWHGWISMDWPKHADMISESSWSTCSLILGIVVFCAAYS